MRYYRITTSADGDRCAIAWGGGPTYWFEINNDGDANRQVVCYPNGNMLSYDSSHELDEYDALQVMVVDGDEEWWTSYIISKDEFEEKWMKHIAMNRVEGYEKNLAGVEPRVTPEIWVEPPF